MGKTEQRDSKVDAARDIQAILQIIKKQKQTPLTLKEERFCNNACVKRFLKAKRENVKKAVKQLSDCLSWRHTMGIESMTADEFTAEIASGFAYVAGHDHESRPVMVLRMKQDFYKLNPQKQFIRLLVFTLEVAISIMPRNVEQFVMLFDASYYRSPSSFMNMLVGALKTVAEYYPGRLHKAFVIDPPSLFSYMWKGVRPFVELSALITVVASLDYEESLEFNDFSSCPRASSLRFNPSIERSMTRIASSSSSRFSFSVSPRFDTLKPWYLSLKETSACKVGHKLVSPLNARSYSFASPVTRTPHGDIDGAKLMRKSSLPSTPIPQRVVQREATDRAHQRTPRPSFLQSPAIFFRRYKDKDNHVNKNDKSRESFVPFLWMYRRPYAEMVYRSMMRPPLGGIVSIIPSHMKRHHVSMSQRF